MSEPSPEQIGQRTGIGALASLACGFVHGLLCYLSQPSPSVWSLSFAAVMPLVIFFVPDPPKGVAEMVRVVRPDGLVSAYAWDMPGGGFPYANLLAALRAMGKAVPMPPNPDAARVDTLRDLWSAAGVVDVETRTITVERTFSDFADYWTTVLGAPSAGASIAGMKAEEQKHLQALLREQLPIAPDGSITCRATANAVKGRVSRA